MHEDLLGYLLGALDADEQRRIEARLAVDPELQRELERLRGCLEPLAGLAEDVDPPAGLAERTLASIDRRDQELRVTPHARAWVQTAGPPRLQRYTGVDRIVLALVGVAALTLLLPALANSRHESRKVLCANNLRTVGSELIDYSQLQPDHSFPQVAVAGPRAFAGVFAPILLDHQLLDPDRPHLVCPASTLAQRAAEWSVPTLERIDRAQSSQRWLLQSQAAGSYAYCVGYVENNQLQAVKNEGRAHFAILADTPSLSQAHPRSANHGGRGQNIFFEDGHVAFVIDARLLPGDDPFRNRNGLAEAGTDRADAVILPSLLPPLASRRASDHDPHARHAR
ncbi:MAG: hypothetical protein MUF48_24250 [Pirellulaceae bacterium]|jgi:hypothetical protein|nr:hypothetical protein [Pirellulaceae bacterium]